MSGRTQLSPRPTQAEVDAACRQWLGAPRFSPQSPYIGCYVPALDAVFYPKGREDVRDHEMGHARGWNHNENGRGTNDVPLDPKNVFDPTPAPLTQAQIDYLAGAQPRPRAGLIGGQFKTTK
jgi:hypothetical protein